VSHDPDLGHLIELADGTRLTAVDLLWRYHEMASDYLERRYTGELDDDTTEVMHWWGTVLDELGRGALEAVRHVDWAAKLAVLQGYRDRDGLEWSDPRLRAVDIQWSDVRAEKGVFHRLEAAGRYDRLVDADDVLRAVHQPPEDTRAYFRGQCLARYPTEVAAASWDSVIFDIPGQASLQRVPMLEPLRGTRDTVEPLFLRSRDARTLLEELASAAQ
jgi:proteasome accessory factor A